MQAAPLQQAFAHFLSRDIDYRKRFLQRAYKNAFDGYSYMGQEDSSNQYAHDQLHSFVLSNLHPVEAFPVEFRSFLMHDWHHILSQVKQLEQEALVQLGLSHLIPWHADMAHMLSCNFYPVTSQPVSQRLSEHKDVSLLSVFPFGVEQGLSYQDANGRWEPLGKTRSAMAFPGYLMEHLSQGEISALEHRVGWETDAGGERYSFAFFSIPRPTQSFPNRPDYRGEDYYQAYLSLF